MDGYRGNDDLMCTEASFGLAQENPQVQHLYLGALFCQYVMAEISAFSF